MLMVHARDQVGALLAVLTVFAQRGIDVRQIENRPVAGDPILGEARFFLEINGHSEDEKIQAAVAALSAEGSVVKVLGSYPAAAWVEER